MNIYQMQEFRPITITMESPEEVILMMRMIEATRKYFYGTQQDADTLAELNSWFKEHGYTL